MATEKELSNARTALNVAALNNRLALKGPLGGIGQDTIARTQTLDLNDALNQKYKLLNGESKPSQFVPLPTNLDKAIKAEDVFKNKTSDDLKHFSIDPDSEVSTSNIIATPGQSNISQVFQKVDNVLSKFDNYTYRHTLFMADPYIQNGIVDFQTAQKIVIAQSGNSGRYFIKDLEITTYPALNNSSRVMQATTINFDVVEPKGLSLLDAIWAASKTLGVENYAIIPYYLMIEFLAYDKQGVPQILPELTRFITLKIIRIETANTTYEGTTYSFRTIAFDEVGTTSYATSIKTNLHFKAATVGEFFTNLAQNINEAAASFEHDTISVYTDIYEFIVDPEIAAMPILGDDFVNDPHRAADLIVYNSSSGEFNIPKGTKIDAIVEALMTSNQDWVIKFILKEVDTGTNSEDEQIQKWWVLEPVTDLLEWDSLKGKYAHHYKYHIKPYTIPDQTKDPGQAKEAFNDQGFQSRRFSDLINLFNIQKLYYFTYTGLNTEILSMDMQFNFLWEQSIAMFLTSGKLVAPDDGAEFTPIQKATNAATTQKKYEASQGQLLRNSSSILAPGDSLSEDSFRDQLLSNQEGITTQERLLSDRATELRGNVDLLDKDGRLKQLAASTGGTVPGLNSYQSGGNSSGTGSDRVYIENLLRDAGPSQKSEMPTPINTTVDQEHNEFEQIPENKRDIYRTVATALLNNVYQYNSAEFGQINMEIRGDPFWLGVYKIEEKISGSTSADMAKQQGVVDYRDVRPIFMLRFRFATQTEDERGLTVASNSDTVTGIYFVTKVVSKFSEGQFTQSIEAFRDFLTNHKYCKVADTRGLV